MASVMEAGPIARTNQLDFDEEVIYKSSQWLYDHARKRRDQPFALTMSLTHPHDPYEMTKDFWDMYEGVDIPMPATAAIPHDQQDPHSQRVLKCIDLWEREMPEDKIRDARRAYFAACTYVDHNIGKLMKVLENCGFSDNTIIVFSGDHGDMLGERGLWYKMAWFEMSARVPLLVHAPGRYQARRIRESVSTMDLMPTFVEMVGSKLVHDLEVDGVSLMPYITDNGGPKPDTVLGEYMGEGTICPVVMIRRGRWKFVYAPTDPIQLYDLGADPLELNNLATGYSNHLAKAATSSKPSVLAPYMTHAFKPPTPPRTPSQHPNSSYHLSNDLTVKGVIDAFLEETAARWDFETITEQVKKSQRIRRLIHAALSEGHVHQWEYVTPDDPTKKYVRNHGKGDLGNVEDVARLPYPGKVR